MTRARPLARNSFSKGAPRSLIDCCASWSREARLARIDSELRVWASSSSTNSIRRSTPRRKARPRPRGSVISRGAAGLGEVVDIGPVVGQRAGRADVLQQLPHQRHPPGAGDPADVNVLARREDLQPVSQRLDGVVLADHAGNGLDLVGGPERRQHVVAAPAERSFAQPDVGPRFSGHGASPSPPIWGPHPPISSGARGQTATVSGRARRSCSASNRSRMRRASSPPASALMSTSGRPRSRSKARCWASRNALSSMNASWT